MQYNNIVEGIFIERVNRFIAHVRIEDRIEAVHVKNTGRCKELFIKGVTVYLEESDNPDRKTRYSLISIYKGDLLINLDSQVPNLVVYEAIRDGRLELFKGLKMLKREVTFGDSRFDLYYETDTKKGYIEVKGVTLESDGIAMFPDAPTTRGSKHIHGLIDGQSKGFQNYIFFLIQIPKVHTFRPNYATDPVFGKSLSDAVANGVTPLIYNCEITRDTITLSESVTLQL